MTSRNYKYDNIRCFLITCVVLGHILEIVPSSEVVGRIYKIIYSFHIPALIFLSGYFAKVLNGKKFFRKLVLPYITFQTLYVLFEYSIMHTSDALVFQYTTPYWLMWYSLALAIYYVLIQFADRENKVVFQVACAIILAIVVGYEKTVGYYLSLSRIIVFFPFFIMGYFFRHIIDNGRNINIAGKKRLLGIAGILILLFLCESFLCSQDVPRHALYGSYPYNDEGCTAIVRILGMISAVLCIIVLHIITPQKKVAIVSTVGQNSLSIFLFHGFIRKLMEKYSLFKYSDPVNLVLAFFLAVVIVIVLGNPLLGRGMKKIFS